MHDLKGKVVLVCGGRGYLGADICHKMHDSGAVVISADIATQSRAALGAGQSLRGSSVNQVDVDVRDRQSVTSIVDTITEEHGQLDVLVYAASTKPADFYLPFTECSLEGWRSVIDVELDGVFLMSQAVGRVMEEKQRGGAIIYLSSIYGIVGNNQEIYEGANLDTVYAGMSEPGSASQDETRIFSHAVYPTVKGGLISLARFLAAYWGSQNIRVNCVSPGGVTHPKENETFVKKYSEKVPLGRKATPEDISNAIIFLGSDAATYITGHNLVVDGGFTAW
jgi:NAD(P)-dependent dehydrogenase (short-subunit alcohol dehydrogenase family)